MVDYSFALSSQTFSSDRSQDIEGPVLVLGSKPDSVLPDVNPKHIYAANAAIEKSMIYRKKNPHVKITSIAGGRAILEDHIRQRIATAKPDRIITKNPCSCSIKELFQELDNFLETRNLSYKEAYLMQHELLGTRVYWAEWIKLMSGDVLLNPKRFMKQLYTILRERYPRGVSAGVFGIIMALREYPDTPIITCGIGLQGGGHFYKAGELSSHRGRIDRYLFRSLPERLKKNIYSQDMEMVENGKVQLLVADALYHEKAMIS